jgi:glutaredoxin 2
VASQPPQLALYHYDTCFFCVRVRKEITRSGLAVELRNIHEVPEHRAVLIEATGRKRVPVLCITQPDGTHRWLPESRDIVQYLRELRGGEPKSRAPASAMRGPGLTVVALLVLVAVLAVARLAGS